MYVFPWGSVIETTITTKSTERCDTKNNAAGYDPLNSFFFCFAECSSLGFVAVPFRTHCCDDNSKEKHSGMEVLIHGEYEAKKPLYFNNYMAPDKNEEYARRCVGKVSWYLKLFSAAMLDEFTCRLQNRWWTPHISVIAVQCNHSQVRKWRVDSGTVSLCHNIAAGLVG